MTTPSLAGTTPGRAGSRARALAALLIAVVAGALALGHGEGAGRVRSPAGERAQVQHACRFWGIIGSGYDSALITTQLRDDPIRSFKRLGSANPDGWAFAVFPGDTLRSAWPILRRGRPPATDLRAIEYGLAAEELDALGPRAVLAHIRMVDVRHIGVPDPHPFLHAGTAFVHSGNIREVNELADVLLTAGCLQQHPPDYTVPMMDSELLFLYLLKLIDESPDLIPEAIHTAVVQLAPITGDDRLDCAFTRGDTLYALRYAGADTLEPLVYYPAGSGAADVSPFWAVATQVFGAEPGRWAQIPPRTLAVFVPGQAPQLFPVGPTPRDLQGRPAGGVARLPSNGEPHRPADAAAGVPRKGQFWGMVGTGYPAGLLDEQLHGPSGLRALGGAETLGWGWAAFAAQAAPEQLRLPLFYRGGPPASDPYDPDFDRAVGEIASVSPRAALGHVRAASSSHPDVPDPHPFQHDGLVFVHNGTLSATPILEYLLNTEPRDFLETHPPEYTSGHIDSELYMLYLLKFMQVHPGLPRAEALRQAIFALGPEVSGSRLNFLLTEGDTLYALRYNDGQGVVFGPGDLTTASPYWVAASESVGHGMAWHTIPEFCLAVFVPGQAPQLYPVDPQQQPTYEFATVNVRKLQDEDGDGWTPHVEVCCDPNVAWGSVRVSVRVLSREAGGEWRLLLATKAAMITGDAVDTTFCPTFWVDPDTLPPTRWDLRLELVSADVPGEVLAQATAQTHPAAGLADLPVEGALRDATDDRPPRLWLDAVDVSGAEDVDGDGYARAFTLGWAAGVERADSAEVYVKFFWSDGSHLPKSVRSETHRIRAGAPQPASLEILVRPPTLLPCIWDCYVELFDAVAETLAERLTGSEVPELEGIYVEGEGNDEQEPPEAAWIGAARPSPGSGGVTVPVGVPAGGAELRLRVFDAQGRLVRALGPLRSEAGETTLTWDGRDGTGCVAAAGIYHLEVRVGDHRELMRCAIVRRLGGQN